MAAPTKRIAIVGAGPGGLVAIKECLAAGFSVQCFERAHAIGGQWLYEPDPTVDTHSNMYLGIILNSCRDATAFSDFPLDPARYPIFYNHRLHLRYLHEYAAHFGLEKHVRLNTAVVGCAPTKGGWEVRVKSGTGEETLNFDAVICSSGPNSKPKIPDIEDRDKFKGEVLHSHEYRKPGPFAEKKVVIVGLGSSAADIACEVGPHAKEVTIVNRRGGWVVPRFLLGKPTECWNSRAGQIWLPTSVQKWLFNQLYNHVMGPPPPELKPDHSIMEANITIRGDFIEKLLCGIFSIRRANVASFTETGVLLDDGTVLDADAVIFCTGYHPADFPYLPPGTVRSKDAPVDLYKFIIPPQTKDLYLLGQTEQAGPAGPTTEAQARWVAAVIAGKIKLPDEEGMAKDIRAHREWQKKHLVQSERHEVTVEFVNYIDDLLAPLGAVPSGWGLLGRVFTSGEPWRAFKVYSAVMFGIQAAQQWRLTGEGNCRELAEESLLRIDAGANKLSDGEKAHL